MKLVWTRRARRDLTDIAMFIAQDSPEAAWRWIDRIEARAERLLDAPKACRVVPEFDREDVREAIVGNYRLIYRLEKSRIFIVTIFEGHRLLENALEDDGEY